MMGLLSPRVFLSNKGRAGLTKESQKRGVSKNHKENIESKVTYNTVRTTVWTYLSQCSYKMLNHEIQIVAAIQKKNIFPTVIKS